MPDLGLKSFDKLYPMMIRKYQDLIVDQNASEADKINNIILKLNALGKLSNDVVRDWNTVYNWAMNDGLNQDVSNKIELMKSNGELASILQGIFNALTGDMTTLHTTAKDTLVNSINEVDDLAKSNQTQLAQIVQHQTGWLNVVSMGVDNTGITDVTAKINSIIANAASGSVLYFPQGVYLVSANINIPKALTIIGDSYFYRYSYGNLSQQQGTIFKLADGCSNMTMFTKSGLDRVAMINVTLYSTSFSFVETGYIPTAGHPGNKYNTTINQPNVNGIDFSANSWGSLLQNVFTYGFSGTSINCPGDSTINNIYATCSNLGVILSTDTTATNIRVQFCYDGVQIQNGTTIANIRVEEIAHNAVILSNATFFNITGLNIDQVQYNGIISTGTLSNFTIEATISRTGQYYYDSDVTTLSNSDKLQCAKFHSVGTCDQGKITLRNGFGDFLDDTHGDQWQTYEIAIENNFTETTIDFVQDILPKTGMFNDIFNRIIFIPNTSFNITFRVNSNARSYLINKTYVSQIKSASAVGVAWDTTGLTSSLTRLGDGIGLNGGVDFNTVSPYSGIKLCNVGDDGTIRAFIGEPSFAKDGSNGEVMVYIPKFYYKHSYDNVSKHEFWVSATQKDGFKLHPAFVRSGIEKPYILVGAYKAGIDGSNKITSRSGVIPKTNASRSTFRTYASNRGSKWSNIDVLARSAVGLLYLIEYADFNSQNAIGLGIVNKRSSSSDTVTAASTTANTVTVSNATGSYYYVGDIVGCGTSNQVGDIFSFRTITNISVGSTNTTITVDGASFSTSVGNVLYHTAQKTGQCDSLNGVSGYVGTNGISSINYRGMEDLWGNVQEVIDGVNFDNSIPQAYIADNSFADGVFTGAYKPTGVTLISTSGFPKNLGVTYIADCLFSPVAADASASVNNISDYFDVSWGDGNSHVMYAGGIWNEGTNAGFFRIALGFTVTSNYNSCGARCMLIP